MVWSIFWGLYGLFTMVYGKYDPATNTTHGLIMLVGGFVLLVSHQISQLKEKLDANQSK